MNERPFYLTTGIFYPNAKPHMGHALELVQADFLARYERLQGRQVYFQTGVDEHGLKIQRTAETAGMDPASFVDQQLALFTGLAATLGSTEDRFIRTTEPEHYKMAQALWKACKGDIYKKTYRAWYNIKQEEFLGSAEEVSDPSVFGVDPKFIELIEEDNYFFALSRYTDQVLELLKSGRYQVVPENRTRELINFVEQKGLHDVSISRAKDKLGWGVPVPGDEGQVMYVWFDALTNYLTGSARVADDGAIVLADYWPADLHIVGKDISRFHAILWPAMLLAAGLPTPKRLLVHGFVLSDGRAMSKSLGNVVDPVAMVEQYGRDAVRWFLLREIPTTDDGDFTTERLQGTYTSTLANGIGNLVSRTLTMVGKYCEGRVPQEKGGLLREVSEQAIAVYDQAVGELRLDQALAAVQELTTACNVTIEQHKPWVLAKDESRRSELAALLYSLLEAVRIVLVLLEPAMPGTVAQVEPIFTGGLPRQKQWGVLESGQEVRLEGPLILFPRKEGAEVTA